jgi:hypothetical protein
MQPSGLVGEIVLPIKPASVEKQFARTPYVANFKAGTTEFILVSLHVLLGQEPASRLAEITHIAQWVRAWLIAPATGIRTCWCWATSTWTG